MVNPSLMMSPSAVELNEMLLKGIDRVSDLKISNLDKTIEVHFHNAILIVDIDTIQGIKFDN